MQQQKGLERACPPSSAATLFSPPGSKSHEAVLKYPDVQSPWHHHPDLQLPSGSREWHDYHYQYYFSREVSSMVQEPAALPPPEWLI